MIFIISTFRASKLLKFQKKMLIINLSLLSWFIGTHQSTFSFRIHEDREILGFSSETTFNRFCPDAQIDECEQPAKLSRTVEAHNATTTADSKGWQSTKRWMINPTAMDSHPNLMNENAPNTQNWTNSN